MKNISALVLLLLCECSTALPPNDVARGDAALAEASVIDAGADDAWPSADARTSAADAWFVEGDAAVSVDDAGDAGGTATDAAVVMGGDCGNGYIEPGEECDPGYFGDGGLVRRTDAPDCHACVRDCSPFGAGAVQLASNAWCVFVVNADLYDPSFRAPHDYYLAWWTTPSVRTELTAALQSLAPVGGTIGGQIALRRFGGVSGTWYMYQPDGTRTVSTWPGGLSDPNYCASITVSATGVVTERQVQCTAAGHQVLYSPPPGIAP